jgi:hypothetical protein
VVRLAVSRNAMRTGAAGLLVAALVVAGCTSESGSGPTHSGPTPADVVPGGTAAPITLTLSPGTPSGTTPRRTTAVRESFPVLRSAPMRKSTPIRVIIPAIGVDSGLIRLGFQRNGSLQVPPNGFPAGWFTGGPTPGELGPAVIAGHVRWAGRGGVFARLAWLRPGDRIVVTRQDRSRAVFQVSRVRQYPKSAFPSAAVYGDLDQPGLRLITCGGLDAVSEKFEANLVVFAALVD